MNRNEIRCICKNLGSTKCKEGKCKNCCNDKSCNHGNINRVKHSFRVEKKGINKNINKNNHTEEGDTENSIAHLIPTKILRCICNRLGSKICKEGKCRNCCNDKSCNHKSKKKKNTNIKNTCGTCNEVEIDEYSFCRNCKGCCRDYEKCNKHHLSDNQLTYDILNEYKGNLKLAMNKTLPESIINFIVNDYLDARKSCSLCVNTFNNLDECIASEEANICTNCCEVVCVDCNMSCDICDDIFCEECLSISEEDCLCKECADNNGDDFSDDFTNDYDLDQYYHDSDYFDSDDDGIMFDY
jgi:hypothetical protein